MNFCLRSSLRSVLITFVPPLIYVLACAGFYLDIGSRDQALRKRKMELTHQITLLFVWFYGALMALVAVGIVTQVRYFASIL
jgi:hypothetical protein